MKKEQLYEVLGNIDESYINNAKKDSKKKTIFNSLPHFCLFFTKCGLVFLQCMAKYFKERT